MSEDDKELMYILYYQENLTLREISEISECCTSLVSRYIKQIKAQKRAVADRAREARIIAQINQLFRGLAQVKKQHRLTSDQMFKLVERVNHDTYKPRKRTG